MLRESSDGSLDGCAVFVLYFGFEIRVAITNDPALAQ
jgi:hypothetical protein